MEYKTIRDHLEISRIGGFIEGLSTMEGAQISRTVAIRLEEAADHLSAYVNDMCAEDVNKDVSMDGGKSKIGFGEA